MPRWPKRKPRPGVDEYGRSPLWYAAADGDVAGVRQAVASGLDPSAGDDVNYTPLHVAVQNGHVEAIRALLELGAGPNVTDQHGNGPLWTSVLSAPNDLRAEIAALLLDAGADPDTENIHGRTPRQVATEIGFGLEKPLENRSDIVLLRDVAEGDLPIFFEHQCDPEANRMAAFSPRDREAFMAHWKAKILADDTVIKKTILCGAEIAGNIVCYEHAGRRLVGYWLGRDFWGRGLATRALSEFLAQVEVRPLDACVAKHNAGSIRVLEKCGFTLAGEGDTPSGTGGDAIEELVFTLAP